VSDCVLDRISGEAFVAAVQADDSARATFLRRAEVGLARSHPSKVAAIGRKP
jgi:hypothetical protein